MKKSIKKMKKMCIYDRVFAKTDNELLNRFKKYLLCLKLRIRLIDNKVYLHT